MQNTIPKGKKEEKINLKEWTILVDYIAKYDGDTKKLQAIVSEHNRILVLERRKQQQ